VRAIAERAAEVLGQQPELRLREELDPVDLLRPRRHGGEGAEDQQDHSHR
jgi:hypothetical protein